MKIFNNKIYLKKIQQKQLTIRQVANKLNTTVDTVELAYEDYIKEENPFKRTSFEAKNAIIQIVISLVSTLLVLFTLFEMQADRNAAYLPDISFENIKTAFSWNDKGQSYVNKKTKDIITKLSDDRTAVNSLPNIRIYNLGVGVAKNIAIKWNTLENIERFSNVFKDCNDVNVYINNNLVHINTPLSESEIWTSDKTEIDFLLNSRKEFETLSFPLYYYELIKANYIWTDSIETPPLHLNITYRDVQGVTYNKLLKIKSNILFAEKNPDGSGFCILNLSSGKENHTMNVLESININSNVLLVITSICAVFLSIISIVITIIFSCSQVKHNKNSVRPISAIRFNDYEDEIAVKLQNVGTGPLIIKRVYFIDNSTESSKKTESPTLLEMMPHINQDWSDYTECVDGWTIKVGGQLVFLEIEPEDKTTKEIIRKKLSKITAYVEYTDIYNTKFFDERKLDFFGRNLE